MPPRQNNKGDNKGVNLKMNLPPYNLDAERSVLGTVILENKALTKVLGYVNPDTFYEPRNVEIWSSIIALNTAGKAIDSLTILDWLTANDKITSELSREYIVSLTNGVVGSSNLESHARIIEEKAIARRYLILVEQLKEKLYRDDEDISDNLNWFDLQAMKARKSLSGNKNTSSAHIGQKLLDQLKNAMENGGIVGIPTGLIQLDKIITGLRKSRVYMFGARTRHGKSAVAAAFAYNSAKNGIPAVMFSMEMPDTELYARLVSMELRNMGEDIPYSLIDSASLTQLQYEKVVYATQIVMGYPIIIDDTSGLTIDVFRAKLLKEMSEKGAASAYVDYIQLMKRAKQQGETKADEIEALMASMKTTAREFDIPICILSQIGRAAENKPGSYHGEPDIEHLKGSGGLEENSDVILLMWRPEVNDAEAVDEHGESLVGMMCIKIAKNKMGPTGVIITPFDVRTNYFDESDFIPQFSDDREIERFPSIKPNEIPVNPDDDDDDLPF